MAPRPKPPKGPAGSVDDLVMVGHSLAEAFRHEDWETLTALLQRRALLLKDLASRPLGSSDRALLDEAIAFGDRLVAQWESTRRTLIEDSARERQAQRAYRTVPDGEGFGAEG